MDKTKELADRLYDLQAPWDRESDTMDETIETIKQDPQAVIEYLLDLIDDLRA